MVHDRLWVKIVLLQFGWTWHFYNYLIVFFFFSVLHFIPFDKFYTTYKNSLHHYA